MAVTTTTQMNANVVAAYDKAYLNNFQKSQCFWELINWHTPVGADLKGLTVNQPVIEKLALATSTLTEGTDVTPVQLVDNNLSITVAEYGNAIESTSLLHLASFTPAMKQIADALGQNQANSMDYIVREVAVAGTFIIYAGTATSRLTVDATGDPMSYAFLADLYALADGLGIPQFEDGSYATIVHPSVYADIQELTEYKAVGEYSDPTLLYTGKKGLPPGGRFKREKGMIANIRIIVHPYGKLFLGGGEPAQAATDIDGAAAAGDTDIDVTDATGITVGNYITVGDKTSLTHEQVLVTAVSTNNLTIRGIGNAIGNFGLKYAHADTEAVVEAPNVGTVPIFGPQSIQARHATDPGKMGRASVDWKNTAIPKRNMYHSWYYVGGFGLIDKFAVRGEFGVSRYTYGDNQG